MAVERKFELVINETTIPVSVSGPNDGKLAITIGEDTITASVIDSNKEKGIFLVAVGKKEFEIHIDKSDTQSYSLRVNNKQYSATLKPISIESKPVLHETEHAPATARTQMEDSSPVSAIPTIKEIGTVTAPLPGRVVEVNIAVGDRVKRGDVILVLEAMKMLNQIRASQDGVVSQVHVQAGKPVEKGQPLVTIK
ncbi:MAG: acetyl-CoA carboxylase biotin carboxyl carrier protein [Promethearchaeota archaeon]